MNVVAIAAVLTAWTAALSIIGADWKRAIRSIRTGMIAALAVLVIELPCLLTMLSNLDPTVFLNRHFEGASVESELVLYGASIGMILLKLISLTVLALMISTSIELASGRREVTGRPISSPTYSWLMWGVACGAVAGLVSYLLSHYGVLASVDAKPSQADLYPALDRDSYRYLLTCLLPIGVAGAIREEVLYRGILQTWIGEKLSKTRTGLWVAVCSTSAIWGATHAMSAQPGLVKVSVVFLFGLLLGWIRIKHNLMTSILCHVVHNILVVAAAGLQS